MTEFLETKRSRWLKTSPPSLSFSHFSFLSQLSVCLSVSLVRCLTTNQQIYIYNNIYIYDVTFIYSLVLVYCWHNIGY
jgi:hypothetical protein